jgi:hypothetical protein
MRGSNLSLTRILTSQLGCCLARSALSVARDVFGIEYTPSNDSGVNTAAITAPARVECLVSEGEV